MAYYEPYAVRETRRREFERRMRIREKITHGFCGVTMVVGAEALMLALLILQSGR